MAKIKRIVIHCTDEPHTAKRNREYYRYFFFVVKNWKHFGYHAIVYQDGRWEMLQPLPEVTADGGYITNDTQACGAAGYNSDSIHIAYVGGRWGNTSQTGDTRTDEQKKTLWALVGMWKAMYKIKEVVGHRDLPGVKKTCPNFDAKRVYANA